MTKDEIEGLRTLHEKATPAPWEFVGGTLWSDEKNLDLGGFVAADDGRLIIEMRNALPSLLDIARGWELQRSKVRVAIKTALQFLTHDEVTGFDSTANAVTFLNVALDSMPPLTEQQHETNLTGVSFTFGALVGFLFGAIFMMSLIIPRDPERERLTRLIASQEELVADERLDMLHRRDAEEIREQLVKRLNAIGASP